MNKKFSTLVASLLLSSAFSVYAGNAKPMLATPTQVETRATSADVEEAVEWPGTLTPIANNYKSQVLPSFTNNARLFVVRQDANATSDAARNDLFVKFDDQTGVNQPVYASYPTASGVTPTDAPKFYWSLKNGQLVDNAGHVFAAKGSSTYFEVIPVVISSDPTAPTYYFVLGTRDNEGKLSYVNFENTTSGWLFGLTSNLGDAETFCSIETEYNANISASTLNDELGTGAGFNLSIFSKIDENATVVNADVFAGTIAAVNQSGWYYQLKNGNKYIVFDTNEQLTSDPNALKGKFKLVDNPNAAGLLDQFCISTSDNGSQEIIVKVNGSDTDNPASIDPYRFYIANTSGTYALSIADYWAQYPAVNTINVIDWAGVTLGDNNIVDLREFLTGQYYTVDFVKSVDNPTDANDAYKKGGRLAIRDNGTTDYADFVEASGLYEKAPEAQWAVSSDENTDGPYFNGTITLTNRENPSVALTISKLRRTNEGFLVVSATTPNAATNAGLDENDVVRITAVTEHSKTDGYAVFDANDLRNKTWYLGQTRQTADNDINVYWAENHTGSHQIGATVEEEKASKWNLSLVKKVNVADKYKNDIDSVLVVSTLQKWNDAKSRIDAVQDTLVILPYAFQNRSNGEFVKFNSGTNLNYYECNDETPNTYDYATDAIFALKYKADGTYNYVVLNDRITSDYENGAVKPVTTYASQKVFQENSTINGTWSQMDMYAKDANSLMFVTEVTAPEYRKLETSANLDTIKIYRADNEAQVVYEKRDAKSVVGGRTLSFLNIDNVEQFKDINPALYADTAYVNRGNNTRYQYLLGVNIEHTEGYYCPIHGFTEADDCGHAVPVSYNKGRYLINMIDTANVYGKTAGIHNNPYINETEEGRTLSKLSFVDAIHVLTDGVKPEQADKLYVINNGDTTEVALGTESLNTVKFAFKYIDSMESSDFKIQTLYMPYNATAYATGSASDPLKNTSEEGYLRWVNGCLVVDSDYTKGDVFNMNENETRTPTANEEISAEGASVVVAGTNGAVVVKGAEGKSVIVSTILGKVVANEVLTSDNAQITAPAGVVVVSVDGESFKVVVK